MVRSSPGLLPRNLLALLAVTGYLFISSSQAKADLVYLYNNLPTRADIPGLRLDGDGKRNSDDIVQVAQRFTSDKVHTLLRVDLNLFKGSTDNRATFDVSLYSATSGLPGSKLADLVTGVAVNDLENPARNNNYNTGGLNLFTIDNIAVNIGAGDYYIVVTAHDADKLGWATGPQNLGPSYTNSSYGSSGWELNKVGSGSMGMRVTAAPEPGTWLMMGFAQAAALGFWWTRKRFKGKTLETVA